MGACPLRGSGAGLRPLDRVEVRDRFLLEEITTTGKRVLAELARKRHVDERAAAE